MPLFSLVAAFEADIGQTFIVNANHNTKDIPGGSYVKDFVIEYIKLNNKDTEIGTGTLKKDSFVIYYLRVGDPAVTFFAFTNKNYSDTTAHKCLETYQHLVLTECQGVQWSTIKKDLNRKVKGAADLQDNYYDDLTAMKSQKARAQLEELAAKARVNYEKVQKVNYQSRDVNLMAKQMELTSSQLSMQTDGDKKKVCLIM